MQNKAMRIHVVLDFTLLLLLLWVDYSVHRNIAVERIYNKKTLDFVDMYGFGRCYVSEHEIRSEGSDDKFTAASQAMY